MRWLILVLALTLGGCNTEWQQERERSELSHSVAPASYKTDIIAFMHTYLNDPTGVRDAFVSPPAKRAFDGINRYASCLRYTAKKINGQYASSKDSLVLYRDGRLDRMIDNAREQCKDAQYQPFPELERLTR